MDGLPARSRRRKLVLLLFAAAALPAPLLASGGTDPCLRAGPQAILAPPGEPGERLRVEGVVVAPDGITPVEGVIVYAWQTDAGGRYAPPLVRTPRLRGYMKTDREGRFAYDTIRPGSYPGERIPAHVHHQLWGAGHPPQYGNDLLLEDDQLVSEAERRRSEALGPFAFVRPVERRTGHESLVTLRLRLKTEGDRFEASTRHGVSACANVEAGR